MGLYDRVQAPCPNCGNWVEWQSKAGECNMSTYFINAVPVEIAKDILNEIQNCDECGRSVKIWSAFVLDTVPMAVI